MWERLHGSMSHWYRLVGRGSGDARVIERDGVVASLVPAAAERSIVNAVVYEDAKGLARAYDEVAKGYEEIGAQWTVWVHEGDAEASGLLERAGHVLDASPQAMALDLHADPVERPPADALADWTSDGALTDVGAINDRAYPFGGDSFSRALTRLPGDAAQLYVARADGEPVACCATIDAGSNTEVQMVAVVPEQRGAGLSGKLLAHALADARERGVETSTLVATPLGRPVYERLGFRPLGALEMWELRRARGAAR